MSCHSGSDLPASKFEFALDARSGRTRSRFGFLYIDGRRGALRIALLLAAYLVLGVLLSVLLSSLWSWLFWLSLRAEAFHHLGP
jgi:hypothetical protein